MTEGQRVVAAYRLGTIDGDEALAAAIDLRLTAAAPVSAVPPKKINYDIRQIRSALIEVVRNPTRPPAGGDDFRTFLINGGWVQPAAWIDIFTEPAQLRNEWRLAYRGEPYLNQNPPTMEELSSG